MCYRLPPGQSQRRADRRSLLFEIGYDAFVAAQFELSVQSLMPTIQTGREQYFSTNLNAGEPGLRRKIQADQHTMCVELAPVGEHVVRDRQESVRSAYQRF